MTFFSKQTLNRTGLALILGTLALSFQNCGNQNFQVEQASELPAGEIKSDGNNNSAGDGSKSLSMAVPEITLESAVDTTNSALYTITFKIFKIESSQIKSVLCQLGDLAPRNCAGNTFSADLSNDGDYQIKIMVETLAGMKSQVTKLVRKDATIPQITVINAPKAVSNESSTTVTFNAVDNLSGIEKIECSLDSAAFSKCTSPLNLAALSNGSHTLSIQASDVLKNKSIVRVLAWSVDLSLMAPTISWTQLPPSLSNLSSVSLSFTGVDVARYECSIDGSAFFACSSPYNATGLTDKLHSFSARGYNNLGAVSNTLEYNWVTDLISPTVPMVNISVPSYPVRSTSVTLSFSANDKSGIANYRCLLDGVTGWNPCTNPKTLTGLSEGHHDFEVSAVDMAGNVSAAAKVGWDISSTAYTAIANGGNHACGLTSDKKVKCTGWNGFGALGNGLFDDFQSGGIKMVDVLNLPAGTNAISAGNYHTCALTATGSVKCWGAAIANSNATKSAVPVDVVGLGGIKAISSGGSHSCVITADDKVKCWGSSLFGELGNGATGDSASPVEVSGLSGVSSLYTTIWYSCAIVSGSLKCWGNLSGHMSGNNSAVPVSASSLTGLKSACIGTNYTCVIASDSSVKCWGDNSKGMLGNGTTTSSSTPVDVVGLGSAKSISCYSNHTCAVTADDTVKCWGDNYIYQLGNGSTTPSSVPVVFKPGIGPVKSVGASQMYTCALKNDGYVSCSGNILGDW